MNRDRCCENHSYYRVTLGITPPGFPQIRACTISAHGFSNYWIILVTTRCWFISFSF